MVCLFKGFGRILYCLRGFESLPLKEVCKVSIMFGFFWFRAQGWGLWVQGLGSLGFRILGFRSWVFVNITARKS